MKRYNNYVTYHLHTESSLLDSCTNHKLYADKAAELGQKAICYTEHGNIYSWIEKKQYANSKGLKYMHGVEIYITQNEIGEEKIRDNFHTILIARNYEGVKEINLLVDTSTKADHVYYKPRITLGEFKNISKNVIKISACLASPLSKLRDESLIKYYDFLEIQPHINSQEQKDYNLWLYEKSRQYNKPLIAGTDTHNLNNYKAECRKILLMAKKMEFTNEEDFDLTYKSYNELVEMFDKQGVLKEDVYLEAIENTNVLADMVTDFELDTSFKYPKLYDDEEVVLKQRINKMYKDKLKKGIIKKDPRYKTMVQEEMRVFKKIGMVGFMLFMSELVCWCWENDIPVGYCRGSVGGSMIAYITDIIDVNPLVWNTMFSRFANEDRKEIGDIDLDIAPSQRKLVFEHIIETFGTDKTGYVLSYGTLKDKAVIDEIGRALSNKWLKRHNVEYSDSNPYLLANIANIKKEYETDPQKTKDKYPDIFYYFDGLEGTTVSQSMHPAGIIVSPITLPDNYGTFWSDGRHILNIDMEEIHDVSLVKYDILGLKNIEVIHDTCKLANIPYPKSYTMNWNDTEVWNHITDSPVGIFQFESPYAFQLLKKFHPIEVNSLSLVNASLRPSGESYRDRLLAGETNKNPSELIDELLAPNHGFLCIEENEKIQLKDGEKSIKDIDIGDEVYTTNGLNKVNKVYNNGIHNVIEIKTKYGKIKCTPEHKILSEKGWIEVGKLREGDCIASYCGTLSNNTYDKNKLKFIGWILGDGCSSNNNVGFINLDLDVSLAFKDTVTKIWDNLDVSISKKCKSRVNKIPLHKCNIIWRDIHHNYDKPVHKYLDEIGLRKKIAKDKFIPEFIFSLNRDCILTVLGAYTDTDSCLHNNSVAYKTASVQLANGLVRLIRYLGYLSYITESEDSDGHKGYHVGVKGGNELLQELKPYSIKIQKKCKCNRVIRRHKYGEISILTVKNWLSINNIRTKDVQKKAGISLYYVNFVSINAVLKIAKEFKLEPPIFINENIRYSKIESIINIGFRQVYDLEINNTHNYIANGFVVHNCFQEDTIKFLQQICGLNGSEADNIRRAIGRKQKDRLEKAMPQILEGYCNMSEKPRKIAEEEAKAFLQIIEDSANYQFGYNHSTGYSMIGYTCAYLRYYYPREFVTAYLNNANNDNDINMGTELATQFNIPIHSIKFRYSLSNYTCDKSGIYKGVSSIKFCNSDIAEGLYGLRENSYDSFIDLLNDIKMKVKKVNSRQLEILIQLDFFSEFGDPNALTDMAKIYEQVANKKTVKKKDGMCVIGEYNVPIELFYKKVSKLDTYKESEKQIKGYDSISLCKLICELTELTPTTIHDRIKYSKKHLGYVDIVDKNASKRLYYITSIEGKKLKTVSAYEVHSGKTRKLKCWGNLLERTSLTEDQFIYIKSLEKKNKKQANGKSANGKTIWTDIPNEYEYWLDSFEIIENEVNRC